MNIGDLFLRIIADMKGFNTQVTREATKTGEKAGKNLTKGMTKGSSLKKGIIQGLGLGAGLGLVSAATQLVGGLAGAIGDMTKAAIADEESQSRLRASLKANIPAWSGNTDAIEKAITASQRLGFDDETLRDSLTVLAGATHDVSKAQEIMATAMDLARFKGIDLKTASEALIKVEGGVFRSLKQLGIKLKDNATSQDALNAVQAVTQGQAEAYSKTLGGRLLANQIKFDEAMENFGAKTLPLVSGALEVAAEGIDVIQDLVAAAGDLDAKVKDMTGGTDEAAKSMDFLGSKTTPLGKLLHEVADGVQAVVDQTVGGSQDMTHAFDRTIDDLGRTTDATVELSAGFDKMAEEALETADFTTLTFREMVDDLATVAGDMISDFFDPIHAEEQRHDARLAVFAAQEAVRNAKTKTDRQEAKRAVIAALEDQGKALQTLSTQGKLTGQDVDKFEKDVKTSYAAIGKRVPIELQKIIDKLREVSAAEASAGVSIVVKGNVKRKSERGRSVEIRAAGGPVRAGQPYVVGERRPELFVPSVDGRIESSVSKVRGGVSASAPNISVQLNGLPRTTDPFQAMHQLRRLSEFGALTPKERYG